MQQIQATVLDQELAAACKAVRLASVLCQQIQQQLQAGEKVDKEDNSPVTIADYGAQAVVVWSLQQSLAGQPFSMVAEEDAADLRSESGRIMADRITEVVNSVITAHAPAQPLTTDQVLDLIDQGASEGGSEGRHWVLDPIDGTRGFVGQRQYAVCLGRLQQGQVVLGVLGCPNLPQQPITEADGLEGAAAKVGSEGIGCLFAAQRGQGAFVGPLTGEGLPQQRLGLDDSGDMSAVRFMESYEAKHNDFSFTGRVAKRMGVTQAPLRLDSQAKYGALARGDAAIYIRFPRAGYREKIWDHCAGAVIVQEAGAIISDAAGTPLDFGKGRYLDLVGIVAAPPKVHAALLKAISEVPA
ncbi:hypothetical protein WJX72_005139 [[Myrmecia] bisecta]|uniref:3'(2'),5'-bisphosphate nucleotidase n=1 Tax=[Myrmecia] bisecta TaxID=41462 RepID=A0AAW1PNZ1_9CHLO